MFTKVDKIVGDLASYVVKRGNGRVEGLDAKLRRVEDGFERIDWEKYEECFDRYKRIDYEGGCYGYRLKKEDAVAVQEAHMDKYMKFDFHKHNSKEILIIYRGKLKNINNGQQEYGIGDIITVEPGTVHKVVALEDTDMIGIVIPNEKGYP